MPNSIPSKGSVSSSAKKPSFERYQDPEGELTTGKFKFEFWYVRNKILLYRLAIISLVIFLVVNFLYSILTFGSFLIFGTVNDNRLYQQLSFFPNYTMIHPRLSPQQLQVLGVRILPGGVKKYDVVAEIANPNENFIAGLSYFFMIDGGASKKQSVTILPFQTNLVPLLGVESDSLPSNASLVIDNIDWQRISGHTISNVQSWQSERLNFSVSDFQFIPAGNQDGFPNAHVIRFKLNNDTPFSFKEASFYLGLYQEQVLVGVLPMTVNHFISLESQDIDLRGFAPGLFANEIKLFPNMNLYDSDIYLPPPN